GAPGWRKAWVVPGRGGSTGAILHGPPEKLPDFLSAAAPSSCSMSIRRLERSRPRRTGNVLSRKPLFAGLALACLALFCAWSGLSTAQPPPAKGGPELAAQVKQLFRARCLECHGGSKTLGRVKILDHA